MDIPARNASAILRAVDDRLNVLTGMMSHQKSLTICVRYRDHSVSNELVQSVRACLASRLEKRFPGKVSDRYGEMVIGKCTLRVRAADATKAPDLIITVEMPEPELSGDTPESGS